MNGIDAHVTSGRFAETVIECQCKNGHRWHAPAYTEYGATFFADEERGPCCPVCGFFDCSDDDDLADEIGAPMKGYKQDDDGVWRISFEYPEPECMTAEEEAEAERLANLEEI